MTKLSPSLPGGDANGLGVLARQLVDKPHTVRAVMMLVDCHKISRDTDTGDETPTVRIRRVEPVLAEDYPLAEQVLRRALEQRTGQITLPIDLENELRSLGHDIDPDTGKILTSDDEPEPEPNEPDTDPDL